MILTVPSQVFVLDVVNRTMRVADTPTLRFNLKLEVAKNGDLALFELPEPLYQKASELSDDLPVVKERFPQGLPVYPTNLERTVGAWLVSTDDLVLDIWVEVSRAYMTHLCKEQPKPGTPKRVKPLYQVKTGVALRYTRKADAEIWVRKRPKAGAPLGNWTKDKIEEGAAEKCFDGVHWGPAVTANDLVEGTKCMALPEGEPRNTWTVVRHGVARSLVLPYLPALPKPQPDNANPAGSP